MILLVVLFGLPVSIFDGPNIPESLKLDILEFCKNDQKCFGDAIRTF